MAPFARNIIAGRITLAGALSGDWRVRRFIARIRARAPQRPRRGDSHRPFENYDELPSVDMPPIGQRFLANMEAIDAEVRVLRGTSVERLPELIRAREIFDLIYIDGSHAAIDVLADAALCWGLLARNGLMIFDDYRFRDFQNGRTFECKPAIDAFATTVRKDAQIIDVAAQVYIRRTAP